MKKNVFIISVFIVLQILIMGMKPIPSKELGAITMTPLKETIKEGNRIFTRTVKMTSKEKSQLAFDVQIIWDDHGSFLGISGINGYTLQKYNGKKLSKKQTFQLNEILGAPASRFSDIKLQEPSCKENENQLYMIDAQSGASAQNKPKLTWISGAGQLCYVLWNIVHGESVNEIKALSNKEL
ncbi:hypothetical protein K4L44_16230 [Halosquirtibacter laminarini]|uniref:Uncharacterized protein n=1 Tax=Halosquirtibacter laminarini TaxID=3374600 RepID=A0AC61NIG6_9BACT|nr:hypothetical protein K4L44_16230 [Prolixibacteraceae bacterium]